MTKLHHHPVREGHTPGNENAHWQVGAKEAKEPAPETEKKDSGNSAQAQRARLLAAVAKAQAMRHYNIGAASLDETQDRFDRHPSWRAA